MVHELKIYKNMKIYFFYNLFKYYLNTNFSSIVDKMVGVLPSFNTELKSLPE